jgi:hypothetical protein
VIEEGEDLRFPLESREALDVEDKRLRDHLEGDVAIQPGVAGAIHFPHPAGPDGILNLVVAEAGAR